MGEPNQDLLVEVREPLNPNIIPGITSIKIPPIGLWSYGPIPTVLTFKGTIDLKRLMEAISLAAGWWPVVAGRYEKAARPSSEDTWDFSIRLNSSAIPLSVRAITASSAFPNDTVIQPHLSPYLPDMSDYSWLSNSNSSLLTIRLTTLLPSGHSVLGVKWGHILGDASSANQFLKHLGYFYEHGDIALPEKEWPTFEPHISLPEYPPPLEVLGVIHPHNEPLKFDDLIRAYVEDADSSELMQVTLSREELAAMKEECSGAEDKLSTQDVISAWWIGLHFAAGVGIDTVMYTVNYRHLASSSLAFPSSLPTLCGNVVTNLDILLPTELPPLQIELRRTIALTIRKALLEIKGKPDAYITPLSIFAYLAEKAAIHGQAQIALPRDRAVGINSNLRYNWLVPFGFPIESTRYHTSWSAMRLLRVYEANPLEGKTVTNVELTWNVTKEGSVRDLMDRMIKKDKRRWSLGREL